MVDGIVLFGDVMILIEVKAQIGSAKRDDWVSDRLGKAVSQLEKSKTLLQNGSVPKLRNDFYGELEFVPESFPNVFGLVILAHNSEPYYAPDLVPQLKATTFPIHVFSLKDFALIADRFDTASDMINLLETRTDTGKLVRLLVQEEAQNLQRMVREYRGIWGPYFLSNPPELLDKAVRTFQEKASGHLMLNGDWRYGLLIDDLIARVHDFDPSLPWNEKATHEAGLRVGGFFGWLTRDRRIKLGKLAFEHAELARDGNVHHFHHFHPSGGTCFVYVASSASRGDRVKYLQFLVNYAKMLYGCKESVGVATEATGGGGRSYDFVAVGGLQSAEHIKALQAMANPFSSNLTPL